MGVIAEGIPRGRKGELSNPRPWDIHHQFSIKTRLSKKVYSQTILVTFVIHNLERFILLNFFLWSYGHREVVYESVGKIAKILENLITLPFYP